MSKWKRENNPLATPWLTVGCCVNLDLRNTPHLGAGWWRYPQRPGLAMNASLHVNITGFSFCWTGWRALLKDGLLCASYSRVTQAWLAHMIHHVLPGRHHFPSTISMRIRGSFPGFTCHCGLTWTNFARVGDTFPLGCRWEWQFSPRRALVPQPQGGELS